MNSIRGIQEFTKKQADNEGVKIIKNRDMDETIKFIVNDVIKSLEKEV